MDKQLKLVKTPPCMECIICKNKYNFMFFLNNDFLCSSCIKHKENTIKDYKFFI